MTSRKAALRMVRGIIPVSISVLLMTGWLLLGSGGPPAGASQSSTQNTGGHQHGATAAKAPATAKAPAAKTIPPGEKGERKTITGEVMDPACFLEAGAKSIGPGHFQCAVDCARSGQTLAIYDRDHDRIYFIAGELPGKNPNEPLWPYIHKKVDVTGVVFHRAEAWGIVISRVTLHQEKGAAASDASEPAAGKPASRSSKSGGQ